MVCSAEAITLLASGFVKYIVKKSIVLSPILINILINVTTGWKNWSR